MAYTHYRQPRNDTGFSLVEILVGMLIGLFGIIVMMQVFAVSEERKRTTTGSGEAMTEGVMALYALQRDLRQAGVGISDVKLLGCNTLLRTGVTLNSVAPVTINHASIPAGDANTDTLLVTYASTNGSPQGDGITSQPAAAQYSVQTPTAFVANDWVLATPQARATPCAITLDRVVSVTAPNITVTTGVASMSNGTIFNLGQIFTIMAYAIRNGSLTMCDYTVNDCSLVANIGNATIWVPIASNIVNLRAQYGRDTSVTTDSTVDLYDQTTPTTACLWTRTSAVRLAVVARSAQYEKTAVTTTAPTWDGTTANNPAGSAAALIDVSMMPDGSSNTTWQNYRYKVFQTVVPLRNIAWMGAVSGC
jgi:type IV pilus assembly protein PilW